MTVDPSPTPTRPRVVLIGSMGAGKSTIGEALAARWNVGFRDTDADIVALEGRAIADIFVDRGEDYFRSLERAAVEAALSGHDGVLALGGGAVVDPRTRALLGEHTVVFLQVGLSEAVRRVGLGSSRPMLLGNVRGRIKTLLEERTPIYSEVADLAIMTDELPPDEIVDSIRERIESLESR